MSAPVLPSQPMVEKALSLLQDSSCFRGEVCSALPCACAESLAAALSKPMSDPKCFTGSVDALALADEIESAAALETVGKKWRRLPVGSPKLIVAALRHMAGATNVRSCDVAQAAPEPTAWQWRESKGSDWSEWNCLNIPVEQFREEEKHGFEDGMYEVRPLYDAPQPEPLAYTAWKPIETAPMDGTPVLLLDIVEHPKPLIVVGFFGHNTEDTNSMKCWRVKWDHEDLAGGYEPTHWAPLSDTSSLSSTNSGDAA